MIAQKDFSKIITIKIYFNILPKELKNNKKKNHFNKKISAIKPNLEHNRMKNKLINIQLKLLLLYFLLEATSHKELESLDNVHSKLYIKSNF
jgi:hypothetical protein